jgi:hypothetical protein
VFIIQRKAGPQWLPTEKYINSGVVIAIEGSGRTTSIMPIMTAQKLISHEADVGNGRPACFHNLSDLATLGSSGLQNPEYPEITHKQAALSIARAIYACTLPTLVSSCPLFFISHFPYLHCPGLYPPMPEDLEMRPEDP